MKNKLLILTGPTATGKTSLGLKLAREFNGEILSADSRQAYKHMDIGTGKDVSINSKFEIRNLKLENKDLNFGTYDFDGVPVWGLDIVEPDYKFNVSDWVKYAQMIIQDIQSRNKLPIIVGGTGLYIKALLEPPNTIDIPIDIKLRESLSNNSVTQLINKLLELDSEKWEKMNESDRNNPRRLIRAIEVAHQRFKIQETRHKQKSNFQSNDILVIGLTASRVVINQRIDVRVEKRMKMGMVEEVKGLIAKGYSWDLPSMSSLGYREFKDYILTADPFSLAASIERWKISEHQYAKRQLTYLEKYLPGAKWFDISSARYIDQIRKLVHNFVE